MNEIEIFLATTVIVFIAVAFIRIGILYKRIFIYIKIMERDMKLLDELTKQKACNNCTLEKSEGYGNKN